MSQRRKSKKENKNRHKFNPHKLIIIFSYLKTLYVQRKMDFKIPISLVKTSIRKVGIS